MTSSPHRFRIVAALDRSEYAEIVLEHAIDQAVRHEATDLHFLTVAADGEDVEQAKTWLAQQVLLGLDNIGKTSPDWRSRLHVVRGHAADEIASLAADLRADLLVIGRFGIHERKGLIADQVLAKATCPTLVVGLTERTFDTPQCPKCAALRENSEGERWFCDEHLDGERNHFTVLMPSVPLMHGGLLL